LKTQLPNSDRFENLSWRLMSINLQRLKHQAERFVLPSAFGLVSPDVLTPHRTNNSQPEKTTFVAPTSAPSGIAQLRKASDQRVATQPVSEPSPQPADDPMNLDDFLVPTSIASPAGLSPSPSGEKMMGSTAIPIRKSFGIEQDSHLCRTAPQSAPIRGPNDFGYVQRHARKTSIDERRVCRQLNSYRLY